MKRMKKRLIEIKKILINKAMYLNVLLLVQMKETFNSN